MKLATEIIIHNQNLISVKDLGGKIDLSASKWDTLFQFLYMNTQVFYFEGRKGIDYGNLLQQTLNYVLEEFEYGKDFEVEVFGRIKDNSIVVSRSNMNNLWNFYDTSAIFFLANKLQESELRNELRNKSVSYVEILEKIQMSYILYRGIEADVLWIAKSNNVPSPPLK